MQTFSQALTNSCNPAFIEVGRKLGIHKFCHYFEAFGLGGMHFIRRNLLDALERLTSEGVSVVVVSQCLYDASDLRFYEVGTKLLSCGVISGRDMTTEAAVTKLMWALGQTGDPDGVRRIFATSYCGEISLDAARR